MTLWDPVGYPVRIPDPTSGLGNPFDEATLTLTLTGSAVFVSASGRRLDLVAHPGPKEVFDCY